MGLMDWRLLALHAAKAFFQEVCRQLSSAADKRHETRSIK